MHLDTEDKSFKAQTINCDLCIVGAGPAGIIIADHFKNTALKVCLLESGDFELNEKTQSLADGEISSPSPELEENYLSLHSQRRFGGTGTIWGGYCREMDELDFIQRDLPFFHQWPISKADIAEFYPAFLLEKKHRDKNIKDTGLRLAYYERTLLPFDAFYKQHFNGDENITLITNATVTGLLHDKASTLNGVEVSSQTGQRFDVNASAVVLACGGVGNARLLLNADSVSSVGLGNEHDNVGRYFAEHPHFQFYDPPALVWLADDMAAQMQHDQRYKPALTLSADRVTEHKLLNFSAKLSKRFTEKSAWAGAKQYKPNFSGLATSGGGFYSMAFRAEQQPNLDSRVTLTKEKDFFGQRRVKLDWRLTEYDQNSLLTSIDLLSHELGRIHAGRLKLMLDEGDLWQTMVGGGHLMCTTRMSERPEDGVVDSNCRVHSVDNLYLAGSSVFATGGMANPTATIIALARRLAPYLEQQLGKAG